MESGIELRMWIGVWIGMWNVGCGMWNVECGIWYVYPASLRSYTSGGWGHSGTGVWCAIEANNLCTLLKFTNGDDRTKKILQILAFADGFQPLKRST